MKKNDDEIEEFVKFLGGLDETEEKPEETDAVEIVPMAKEFRCITCGMPFSRKDCGIEAGGVFVSVKRCPFKDCKSELIVRQKESGWAAERKYDVSIEEATLGPKPGKYAGLAAKKSFQSGKIKRKS